MVRRCLSAEAVMLLLFICLALPAGAGPLPDNPSEISWHISAVKATHDQERDLYIAEGDVIITGGRTRLEADYVEFSNATKDAMATGHVFLVTGQDTVTCDAIRINLATETGTIYKGVVFLQENNFYIQGDQIRKTGEATYTADKASITSCSGPSPDWRLSGRDIQVTVEGFGVARHATLWAKTVPAAYTPYLLFPVKTQRQTGLLYPMLNISSRKGFEYEQPLFFALSRNTDATLYVDHMTERGTKLGGEFRYLFGNGSRGAIMADYLDDREIDDGTAATSDYSYEGTPQRTNEDRYWIRMKHDQYLPADWKLTLDIDYVSDADYLHEFKKGASGFTSTRSYFEETFGRSLDDYDETVRENSANLNKTWESYSLNLGLNWYDDVTARTQDQLETTLQELPALTFASSRQPLFDSPVYADLDSDYRYFYRKDTTDDLGEGHRADIHPRFYLPVKVGRYLSMEPSAGIRQTVWYSDNAQDSDPGIDMYHRELYDLNFEMSSRLSRVFNTSNGFAEKIQHEIIPKLEYGYIPDDDQDELPDFDFVDRIDKKRMLTWSLTNRFTARKTIVTPGETDTDPPKATPSYREFAWIKLSQSYDFLDDDTEDGEHFKQLSADAEFSPCDYLSVDIDADWSPRTNEFVSYNTGVLLKDRRGDSIYAAHRFEQDISESFYARVDAALTSQLSAFFTLERNLYEDETIESSTGINVYRQCWTLALAYSNSSDDTSIAFLISLHGIGDIGTR